MTLPVTPRAPASRLLLCAAFLALASCGSSGSSGTEQPAGSPTKTREPTAPPDPPPVRDPGSGAAGARVEDPSFVLSATPGGPHALNTPSTFEISLVPRGAYHVNTEFPMRISLTAPAGLTTPRATLEKTDAAELTERRARFEVPFTATAAGEHRLTARVEFAVCTPENCIPDERTLAVVLPARAN